MIERFVMAEDLELPEVKASAKTLRWAWVGTKRPDDAPNVGHVWKTPRGSTVIYVEDGLIGVKYFLVNGPRREEDRAALLRTMRVVSRDDVLVEAERACGFEAEADEQRHLT